MNLQKPDEIYRYICQHKQANDGNSPSYRQIMLACDVSSPSMVNFYVEELRRRNLVRMSYGDNRGRILVVGGKWHAPGG